MQRRSRTKAQGNSAVGGNGTILSYTGHRQEVTVVKAGRDKTLSQRYYVVTFIVT